MKILRLAVVLAASLGALAIPATAQADVSVAQAFAATSGDNCRYGTTDGNLTWRFVAPSHAVGVAVRGRLADKPVPGDPIPVLCPDDHRFSVATFVLYAGNVVVDRNAVRADNGVVNFDFFLGNNSTVSRVDRLVIQVCRNPLTTLPPVYCGPAVSYGPA
jgi:hypothetical protein